MHRKKVWERTLSSHETLIVCVGRGTSIYDLDSSVGRISYNKLPLEIFRDDYYNGYIEGNCSLWGP